MKTSLLLMIALCAAWACSAEVISFDNAQVGPMGPGWTVAMTHSGGAPQWEVRSDDSAPSQPNVLAQTSTDRTAGRFPLAIWERTLVRNGTLTVKFKAVSGSVNQAAGLVWRYHDPANYYVVRADALEDNIVMYKVQSGVRISLAPKGRVSRNYGIKYQVPKTWTTLTVTFHGDLFTVSIDGQKLLEVEDSTFIGAGKTGLWTKADSVIYFDDFQVVDEGSK
ncbi:MAG TPA: hypothetical protein VEU11_11920 [Terriglobales bacterium]|nr:hypothetical protein [Terriglobales bacterium]